MSNREEHWSTAPVRSENIENVRWFLEQYPEFEVRSLEPVLCSELKDSVEEGCLQLLPGIHESDGFFISAFQKKR